MSDLYIKYSDVYDLILNEIKESKDRKDAHDIAAMQAHRQGNKSAFETSNDIAAREEAHIVKLELMLRKLQANVARIRINGGTIEPSSVPF